MKINGQFVAWALVFLSLFGAGRASAQAFRAEGNLVEDGSFENKKWCPSTYNKKDIRTLKDWVQPTDGTPDHFDACAGNGAEAGTPRNVFGDADPVDGTGYAGVVIYAASKPAYREYLTTRLTRELAAGEWVCVSWWVMAADDGKLVCDRMGAALTADAPRQRGEVVLESLTPAVENPSLHMLSDRHSWIKLSDVFQAEGGERWLTLGNFAPVGSSRVLERSDAARNANMWAYLYVDAVEVRPVADPADCECLNAHYAAEVTDPPWQVFLKERKELSSVLFDFDKSDLDQAAIDQLQTVADAMRRNRFLVMEVNGHTDIVGPDGYNLALSERRASTVIDFLVREGVDPNRLKLAYHGSRLPTADNTTADGRRQNRRVEFELLEHAFLPMD